jgi:chromosome segregation ATPase
MLVVASRVLIAQTPVSDAQVTQAVLAEIRQLRSDLQTAAATIQRVQIVMFRIQAEAGVVDRITQPVDQVRGQCDLEQENQKAFAGELEDAEAGKGSVQELARVKLALAALGTAVPQCQAEQAEAESQLRTEQNKMADLQDQLEKLDKALAAVGGK